MAQVDGAVGSVDALRLQQFLLKIRGSLGKDVEFVANVAAFSEQDDLVKDTILFNQIRRWSFKLQKGA
ncbi:hypothetical protein SASPL_147093 [Salvia splendens]|uniref:Uncharacterized protein n=1 Tax=Salvia splendens TaxID=180675 RepID=A0A8X8WD20_SALSN|nr:hypothetical protein SASPL_147093 [Salvia splendens]